MVGVYGCHVEGVLTIPVLHCHWMGLIGQQLPHMLRFDEVSILRGAEDETGRDGGAEQLTVRVAGHYGYNVIKTFHVVMMTIGIGQEELVRNSTTTLIVVGAEDVTSNTWSS